MKLENGYKVIYEKAANGIRTFYASKTGVFADAEQIGEPIEIGKYKLIYEKDGCFYGSESGIPGENDYCFEDLKVVFVKGYVKPSDSENGEGEENGSDAPTTGDEESGEVVEGEEPTEQPAE